MMAAWLNLAGQKALGYSGAGWRKTDSYPTKRLQNKVMMTLGRSRAALGCGNPEYDKGTSQDV
jgi:hypothetical protein